MLDEMGMSQLIEVAAFDRLEGINDNRHWQKLYAILQLGFHQLANLWSKDKIPIGYFNPRQWDNPVIKFKSEVKRESRGSSAATQRAFLSTIVAAHNAGRVSWVYRI